jgi:hypothetical protein
MEAVDWSAIAGSRWYRPQDAQAAADALGDSPSAGAVADLRHAVSNDHAGTLYPAAVPATAVLLEVIAAHPGPARQEALDTLLDWWGCFTDDPGFEVYDDPERGPVGVCEGVTKRVRSAEALLGEVAADPSGGGHHRRAAKELLGNLANGWSYDDA